MRWPVPNIPVKHPVSRPMYKKWGGVLFLMIMAGGALLLFSGRVTRYEQVFLYGVLPAFIIWLCSFGVIWHRYEQSVNNALLWNKESERIKLYWQKWCMQQWGVVSNVVLTPEKEGVSALLGDYADIPAYPHKPRSLHILLNGLHNRLEHIDIQLEKQCLGYRHFLFSIQILLPDMQMQHSVSKAVYEQWDLYPEYINSVDDVQSEAEQKGFILLLSIQDWFTDNNKKHSEFISAQVLTSTSFASKHKLTIIGRVGRVLSVDSLCEGLDILCKYSRLSNIRLRHVWLTGTHSDDRVKIIQYSRNLPWELPAKLPCHLLDQTFGPSGPLSFPVSVALMVDAAIHTGEMQLLISCQKGKGYSFCLVAREFF
ncbi:hypothetical protein [Leclercia adecarboxylata]|uniref:hypothetical protein n=1 Tax=Leclercia adecarboxylata TaxID=83655 RepID=UPI003D2B4968